MAQIGNSVRSVFSKKAKKRLPDISKMIVDINKIPSHHKQKVAAFKENLNKISKEQLIDYAVQYYAIALEYADFRAKVSRRLNRIEACEKVDTCSRIQPTGDTMRGQ